MADLRDEHGNPIQLTDEHGNPVQLTDEHGNPVHLTGVATTPPLASTGGTGIVGGAADAGTTAALGEHHQPQRPDQGEMEIHRSSSSSSSSSEDDGQAGTRKKKGLKDKIKEKLFTGGKNKEGHSQTTTVATTTTTTAPGQHHEHEKKSMIEKIKEQLPGHHSNKST